MPESSKNDLTERQIEVWRYIVHHVEEYGYQPTQVEIGHACGVTKRAIFFHLKKLEQAGYLTMTGEERAIKLHWVKFAARFEGSA